jgi:hypothetical protein
MTSAGTGQPHPLPIIVIEKMRELNEGELKTFLALYHLSMGRLQDLERIDVADVVQITGMHRGAVYKARKRLEDRGIVPSRPTATEDLANRPMATNGSRPTATSE